MGATRTTTRWRFLLSASVAVVAVLLASVILVPALALLDHDTVASQQDLSVVQFGLPLDWVTQDQSGLDPPDFPRHQSLASPLEHPTALTARRYWLNVAALSLVLGTGWAVLARARKSRRDG